MPTSIRIAAVDDYPLLVDGIERVLERADGIEFIARGGSGHDACRIVEENEPDVILLDITMPGGGIEAAREIAAMGKATKIIMLTASCDDAQLGMALAAGAMGYVLKGAGAKELIEAIHTVASGSTYITPSLASRMLAKKEPAGSERSAPKLRLSAREQQIVDLAAGGLTNQEIATRLNLAVSTVKHYMSHVFDKMDVRNRIQAVNTRTDN
jgi:two-component system, NarL family, nitrate/nitrite response regulator NarL